MSNPTQDTALSITPLPDTQYKLFWQTTRRQQIQQLLLTAIVFPLLYLTLELPKIIVNSALDGKPELRTIPWLDMVVSPASYLWILCTALLLAVLGHGGLKYRLNMLTSRAGEITIRWLRDEMFKRLHPAHRHRAESKHSGELIPTMVNECEKVGSFAADAFSVPIFQGGTLLTVLLFLFVQNPKLALAAIIFFPAQVWLVPFIQKRINVLNQARVKHMRVIGVQVTEASTQTNPDSLERVAEEFQERQAMIFRGRIHIYRLKYRLKFLNNLFAQLTPLLFYAVGGWLVIHERLTLGALVAALSAHKHLIAPWKELLDFYQSKENGRVRYEMLRSQFGE